MIRSLLFAPLLLVGCTQSKPMTTTTTTTSTTTTQCVDSVGTGGSPCRMTRSTTTSTSVATTAAEAADSVGPSGQPKS